MVFSYSDTNKSSNTADFCFAIKGEDIPGKKTEVVFLVVLLVHTLSLVPKSAEDIHSNYSIPPHFKDVKIDVQQCNTK